MALLINVAAKNNVIISFFDDVRTEYEVTRD
jgi:hypothetical protein